MANRIEVSKYRHPGRDGTVPVSPYSRGFGNPFVIIGTPFCRTVGKFTAGDLASSPGHTPTYERVAGYPLFAHARNLPEILVNQELSCSIRI